MSLSASERSFIKGLRLFSDFTEAERDEIARRFSSHKLNTNETLFKSGEDGLACYVLLRGRLGIWLDQKERHEEISSVMPGGIFGHIALLDGYPRSASCIASQESVVLELSIFDFAALISPEKALGFKLLTVLTGIVVEQLRATNQRLTRLALAEHTSDNPRQPTSPDIRKTMQEAVGIGYSSSMETLNELDDVEVVVAEADKYRQYTRKP